MSANELSLDQQFAYCENIVEDLLKDRLGDSNSPQRNEKLNDCVEQLQSLGSAIERISLFSTNDRVEELPTSSLRYLLVPAYLAYVLQEINVGMDKRKAYLTAAKTNFREFLQNLLIFELINFKLPWADSSGNQDDGQSGVDAPRPSIFEEATTKRQQKLARLQQMKQLEEALEKYRIEERRDNDEAAQREVILVLLRLWSIRAIKELEMIDEELTMLEQFEAARSSGQELAADQPEKVAKLKPFIIARNAQQKQVFGLGYPSIPTVTVDEWFDQMQKSGGFGKASSSGNKGKMDTFTINEVRKDSEDEDEEDEAKRQAKMRMDEWKDVNPRGWGNTYNKG